MEIKKNMFNGITRGIIISVYTLLVISCMFFINTTSVSAKTEKKITPETYKLKLEEKGGAKEYIKGIDIGLKYSLQTPEILTYDDKLLRECINKLSCFDTSKIIQSQDAKIEYKNNGYEIIKEVFGNKVDKDILYNNLIKKILDGDTTVNLESINCYEKPKFVANSPMVVYANQDLNKYISSNITYNFAGVTQTLDAYKIKDWIWVDGNFKVIIDETKVRSYVDAIANTYNSSLGTNVKVNGGYYGNNHSWIVDSAEETKALIQNIKNGQTITKHPVYAQTSAANYFSNVGETYVEIDMAKQHLWYYKNGYLVVEGDVVTGNLSAGCATPEGVYHFYSKQKDTVLIGPDYEAPVSFWMPFVNQIGLHDASWRSEFGREIYKTDGSHGCVNAPYYLAKTVYDNINVGDTIICYN